MIGRGLGGALFGAAMGAGYGLLPRCGSMVCRSGEWSVGAILGGAVIFGCVAAFSRP